MPSSFDSESMAEMERFKISITDIMPAVAAAAPNPLALHKRWKNLTHELVKTNVARIVDVGDRVEPLHQVL
jgi:hypothetical protein